MKLIFLHLGKNSIRRTTKIHLPPGVSGEVAVVKDAALLLLALQEEQLDLEGNVYSVHCAVFHFQCAVCSDQFAVCSDQCAARSKQRAVCSVKHAAWS